MEPALMAAIVIGGGVLFYCLTKWQFSIARRLAEGYISRECPDSGLMHVGIPPLRLWLRNRKGDKWAKLRHADGSAVWLRGRDTLLSGTK
jgi:hypothetical protein